MMVDLSIFVDNIFDSLERCVSKRIRFEKVILIK